VSKNQISSHVPSCVPPVCAPCWCAPCVPPVSVCLLQAPPGARRGAGGIQEPDLPAPHQTTLDLAPLNAAVRRGLVAPSSWPVPDSLKYQWQVSPPGACGAPLRPRTPPHSHAAAEPHLPSAHSDSSYSQSSASVLESHTEQQRDPHRFLSEGHFLTSPDSGTQSHSGSHTEPHSKSLTHTEPQGELQPESGSALAEMDLVPFDGKFLCQTFERLRSRLHPGGTPGVSQVPPPPWRCLWWGTPSLPPSCPLWRPK